MLPQRIMSAAIGVIYILLMLYIGGWFFKISVLLMSLILMHEFYQAVMKKGFHPATGVGYAFLLLIYLQIITGNYMYIIPIIGLVFIVSTSLPVIFPRFTIIDVMITVFAAIYPGMMILSLIPLGLKMGHFNYSFLILAFFVTWSTDTFAYFTGMKFGKKKLCPAISPKKTVEGSIGGLLGSLFVGIIIGWIFNHYFNADISFVHFIIIGLIGGVFSQIGDLAASSIKRFCGIKDFGKFLPGHGGLMDRFDSLLFTAPLIYFYIMLFINV